MRRNQQVLENDASIPCMHACLGEGRPTRGSGTGPALTGVIDQGRGSKVGCWCEAVTK